MKKTNFFVPICINPFSSYHFLNTLFSSKIPMFIFCTRLFCFQASICRQICPYMFMTILRKNTHVIHFTLVMILQFQRIIPDDFTIIITICIHFPKSPGREPIRIDLSHSKDVTWRCRRTGLSVGILRERRQR